MPTPLKPGKRIARVVDILTDFRDRARPRDKYVVTMTAHGVEIRPFRGKQEDAVVATWAGILHYFRMVKNVK